LQVGGEIGNFRCVEADIMIDQGFVFGTGLHGLASFEVLEFDQLVP
jgi:hypothetical protein